MKNSSGMTMQQVQDKMNMLRDVFTVVRLLDVDSIAKVHSGEGPGEEKEKCSCTITGRKKCRVRTVFLPNAFMTRRVRQSLNLSAQTYIR